MKGQVEEEEVEGKRRNNTAALWLKLKATKKKDSGVPKHTVYMLSKQCPSMKDVDNHRQLHSETDQR